MELLFELELELLFELELELLFELLLEELLELLFELELDDELELELLEELLDELLDELPERPPPKPPPPWPPRPPLALEPPLEPPLLLPLLLLLPAVKRGVLWAVPSTSCAASPMAWTSGATWACDGAGSTVLPRAVTSMPSGVFMGAFRWMGVVTGCTPDNVGRACPIPSGRVRVCNAPPFQRSAPCRSA
ncbi:MAG: hypothetical protein KGZ46_01540 [Hydrogenophaga sp.]|nr:hypothetical protein [Hydrogenophaga sp.]